MEKTENMSTVKAADVSPGEIYEVRDALAGLIAYGEAVPSSPLVAAIFFILDTLEAGKDITLITQPAPEEYVVLGEALARAEDFGKRYGAGPQ